MGYPNSFFIKFLMDFALVLVEDTVYVRRRGGSRTFEVGDLWDCFVVGGLVVEDYFTAEGLVLDFLFEGVWCIDWSKINKKDYLNAMQKSVVNSSDIKLLLKYALTDKINDRETFMKGIDYSYYYEQEE